MNYSYTFFTTYITYNTEKNNSKLYLDSNTSLKTYALCNNLWNTKKLYLTSQKYKKKIFINKIRNTRVM